MFESLVATLLNRFLGSYIENFDPKQLNIGIWNGDVKLKNLRLKKDSLDKFKLPIDVKFGHLGELTLQIPWSNLKSKPVKVIIEDVYLLASPIIIEDFDLEEELKRELNQKMEKLSDLDAIDKMSNSNLEISSDLSTNETFTENLITKIVDNLQVTIKNIHVRYEDDSVLTENPYSIGITLDELSAVSTDEGWLPSFISITQPFTHKLLLLKSLSVYMNTNSSTIMQDDHLKLLEDFTKSIHKSKEYDDHNEKYNVSEDFNDLQYLLKPVSGKGRLTVHKQGATETAPHVKGEFYFEEFGIDLDSHQYRDLLWTASKFHWYMKTYKFRRLRPKTSVSEDPKGWFRYAANSILHEIHERNYKWSWEYFEKRRDQRKAFVSLWKLRLMGKILSEDQQTQLDQLIEELSFDDIKLYRTLAKNEARREHLAIKATQPTTTPVTQSSGGWLSGWWGAPRTGDSSSLSTNENISPDGSMALSDEQRKALYEAIDYDESQALSEAVSLPRDRVKVELLASLKKGGISIRQEKNEPNLAEIVFEGCTTQFYERPDSFLANFQLQEFRVEDGTKTTLYKHIVSVKQSHSNLHMDHQSKETGEVNDHMNEKVGASLSGLDPFFKISFENNPLDGSADSILLSKLKSMTIFYNPHFIEEVIKFFTPPKVHLETVGAIMNAAEATMEGITAQTRLGLQYALNQHKTINVKLDLQAPLIFLPLDPKDWTAPVAILDAGHISVVSNLIDKKEIEEIKEKQKYTAEDWNQLNTLMYDQFTIHLQDAQFLVGPDIKTTTQQLHNEDIERSALILDKLNIKLILGISILPDAYNLAKFKIGAEVPKIKLTLNDFQYKTIMQLIDVVIPNTDQNESDDPDYEVVFNAFGHVNEARIEDLKENSEDEVDEPAKPFVDSKKVKEIEKLKVAAAEQHQFEFDFSVGQVTISLLRCIDGVTLHEEPLVDLVGDQFKLFFYKTENDMKVELTLEDINLFDNIEKSGVPEFEKLISSNNFDQLQTTSKISNGKKKDIFRVDYTRQLRIVEYNNKLIEVFDQDVQLNIATVKFVITRKSLLSILNFILNTFVDPNAPETPADQLKHNDANDDEQAPAKIKVQVLMDSIIVVLNEDGLKLATLELSTADIYMLILPEALDIRGKLGALSLHDEINGGSPRNSILRNLINIEGQEGDNSLAEFSYKTFDLETNTNMHNAEIEFKTGSPTINFVEDSFGKIFNYLSQFQKMKEIYDNARDTAIDQAQQLDYVNRIKFDVLVQAPTIVFPKFVDGLHNITTFDQLKFRLGEFYASNKFVEENGAGKGVKNVIQLGIRKVNISSKFHFADPANITGALIKQTADIVEDLDISFEIDYLENYEKDRPTIVIYGKTPAVELKLTELQLRYLTSLSDSVSRVFDTSDVVNETLEDIEQDAVNANAVAAHNTKKLRVSGSTSDDIDQGVKESSNLSQYPNDHRRIDFSFKIPSLSLVLFNNTAAISDISGNALLSFTLNQLKFDFKMTEDTHFVSDFYLESFVVKDIRNDSSNKFADIIPLLHNDKNQISLSATSNGPVNDKNITLILSVDSPQMILALDYLFELQTFVENGTPDEEPRALFEDDEIDNEISGIDDTLKKDMKLKKASSKKKAETENDVEEPTALSRMGFSINITNPSVILLADSSESNTEAVVFKIEQILLTSQNITSLAANNIGMFLCQMNDINDHKLRIIDDFSISFAHDSRGSNETNFLTNIQASIDPLLMRLSLRDIRLALTIFNKASELYSEAQMKNGKIADNEVSKNGDFNFSEDFKKRLSHYAPTIISNFSTNTQSKKVLKAAQEFENRGGVIVKGEELNISIGGLRFVLIGDVHELPVLDMNIKPFEMKAINWSTDLSAETHFESYVNIYNYARSSWEPLLEPWPIAVYASRVMRPSQSIMVDVISRKLTEVTLTSRSIALLSQVLSLITTQENIRPRGEDSPYRIINETGYDVRVWNDRSTRKLEKFVKNGASVSWEFEDWTEVRENLDTDKKQGIINLELCGSLYDKVTGLSVMGEGEELFILNPPVQGVHNRLSIDVKLGGDNVKIITLKSTVLIQNDAENAILILAWREKTAEGEPIELTIQPQESHALPIDYVYRGSYKIRPHTTNVDYNWCEEDLSWKDLFNSTTSCGITMSCSASAKSDRTSYHYHVQAIYDHNEPLAKIYPHMTVVISAPVEIENLLPFDLDYRLYDKSTKRDWNGSISKGVNTYVHVASLKSLLLLSVEPKNCGYSKSEFAIINSPINSDFKKETTLITKHAINGQRLRLRIHYGKKNNSSTNLKVVIYSPYVILNKTGQNLCIGDRGNMLQIQANSDDLLGHALPAMFSFDKDDDTRNRAILKISDSNWSAPLSFDAIGQSTSASAQLNGRQQEMNVGVSIAEGEGKYKLSKVVTIAPRYIIQNNLDEDIQVVENGSTKPMNVQSGGTIHPLYGLRRNNSKSLLFKLNHSTKPWSAPFSIDDIGETFLKLYKDGVGQVLLKVSTIIENATLFILIESANNNWPYSIRNFSDYEFYIYQGDPNVNENGDAVRNDIVYKPIFYKIPPKSVMPYAYDYPSAVIKELYIRSHDRERAVNLAEIGNLRPFRLPATARDTQDDIDGTPAKDAIVDLNVVADGPTQSLIISNYDPSLSLYKIKDENASGTSLGTNNSGFEASEKDEYHTKVITKFEGFGISLINTRDQELCYITLRGLEVRYNESDLYQNLSVKLKWIQIDNQLFGGIFPIVLYPSIIPKSGKEMNNHPAFSASVCKVKDDSHGVLFIKYATVLLQEMTIEIDEDFLFALLDFAKFPGGTWNQEYRDRLCDDNLEIPQPKTIDRSSDMYFEALHLQPTITNLSFVRTERVNAEDKGSSDNTLMFFFNVLTMAIGNINDAPIKLNSLFIENIKVPLPVLIESIQTHYGQAFFYQVHKVLGSADFLGNPVGLFNNISSGVLDIFYEPYQGFIINDRPQELGIGIAKGGLSFLKKSVFGFSDSFAKVTGSIAKGLSVVTLDKKFQERRRLNQRRNKPKHALYGFALGANSFIDSIASGVTGIATAPIEGAVEDGALGFFKGLGKGVVGLPTKTAIGFFDLASNVSEGIRNTTTVFDAEGLDKVRLPRYISAYDHIARPYSQREAQGQFWLKSIDGGEYYPENYLAHLVLPGEEKCVLVTFKKLFLFQINSLKTIWVISFDQVKSISIESTGLSIGLKGRKEGPFVPIPEKKARSFLYGKIGIAVQEFNKTCQVIL